MNGPLPRLLALLFLLSWSLSGQAGPSPAPKPDRGPRLATRFLDDQAGVGPRLFLPPLRLPLKSGLPSLGQAVPSHHGEPLHAELNLLGRRCPLVLACNRPGPNSCGGHRNRPDTLHLDLQGDRRFDPSETHTLVWPKPKAQACPHCGHASLHGDDTAAGPELTVAGNRFRIQVKARGDRVEAYLIRRNWRSGQGMIAGVWHRLLYQDRDLDGRVGPADRWLLAGLGDVRLRDRLLDGTRLRAGTVPFPFPGGRALRLDGFDGKGRARFTLLPDNRGEEAALARRAAATTRRWAATLALDDRTRRARLGLPPGPTGPRHTAPWRHRASYLPPRPGGKRPRLLWLDEEESTLCRRLEHYTLGEKAVGRLLARDFEPVHIHLGLCRHDLRGLYGVASVPALILVDRSGKVAWRHTGFLTPARLLAALAKHGPEKTNKP